jgi:hypothetical protein
LEANAGNACILFQTDFNRFWEIAMNDDSETRFNVLPSFDDLLLCEVVRYGVFNKQEMIGPLASFYRGPVMQIPEEFVYHPFIVLSSPIFRGLSRAINVYLLARGGMSPSQSMNSPTWVTKPIG